MKGIVTQIVQSKLVQALFAGFFAILSLTSLQFFAVGDHASLAQLLRWSSDDMMQTLPIAQLLEKPLESIYFLHIQPPLLDVIRALTASFFIDQTIVEENALINTVDSFLLKIYVVLFGVLSAMIFLWVRLATASSWFAGVVTFGWAIYPTPIFLSTFLDGTLLSTVVITWMIFEIWLTYQGRASAIRLSLAVVLCFLARSFFQWYFLPILFLSLILVGMKGKQLGLVCLIIFLGVGGYLGKQYLIFGTPATSTFAGEHLTGVLWIEEANPSGGLVWTGEETEGYREMIGARKKNFNARYPTEAHRFAGGYNTQHQWSLNFIHSEIANKKCVSDRLSCVSGLWRSVRQNWSEYWHIEGWDHSPLVDWFPDWHKATYFRLSTRYLWFMSLAVVLFLFLRKIRGGSKTCEWRKILGLILVPGFIFGVCIFGNRFDWYEAGRMKFFLEPVYLVFISSQIYLFGAQLRWKTNARRVADRHIK